LPKEENQSGLALRNDVSSADSKDYSHEMALLYNMLMKTQQELRDLKAQLNTGEMASHLAAEPIEAPKTDNEIVEAEAEVVGSRSIEEANRETIIQALEQCHGNRKMAANQLGISERTLYRKIKEYGL